MPARGMAGPICASPCAWCDQRRGGPVHRRACHGCLRSTLVAPRWPSFQPHLAAAVPGPQLSPFVRRHIPVVASERTGCLISQLRREPPHLSKCCPKLSLLLFLLRSTRHLVGVGWVNASPRRLGPEGGWLVHGWVQLSRFGHLIPRAHSLADTAQHLQPVAAHPHHCGAGSALQIRAGFCPPFGADLLV